MRIDRSTMSVVTTPNINSVILNPGELWLGSNMAEFLSKCNTWEAMQSQQE